jgi:glycerophosphoryl diester phosphodiesterase
VPFLLHDATLERTSDGRGPAGALDWSRLSRLDAGGWHGRAFAGEPLPTLEAVARWCVANGHALDLEIKPSPGRERETGGIVAEAAARHFAQAALPPLLTSFRPEALAAAREAAPGLPRGLLLDTLRDGWLDEALGLGCRAVVAQFALMDAAVRQRLRESGLAALVYTVNDPAEVLRLQALDIDGIVTDAVDRFAPGREDGGA